MTLFDFMQAAQYAKSKEDISELVNKFLENQDLKVLEDLRASLNFVLEGGPACDHKTFLNHIGNYVYSLTKAPSYDFTKKPLLINQQQFLTRLRAINNGCLIKNSN